MAADSEIGLLTRGPLLSKATLKTWPSQPEEEEDVNEEGEQPHVKFLPPEGGIPSSQLSCPESESNSTHEAAEETRPSDAMLARPSLSFNTSQLSVQSTDTTLEYYDAPLPEEQEGEGGHTATEKEEDIVTVNIQSLTENEEPEQKSITSTEQNPPLTPDNGEREGQEAKEDEIFEDVMEIGLEQEDTNKEEVQSETADEEVESETADEEVRSEPADEVQSEPADEEVQNEPADEGVQSERADEEVQSETADEEDVESKRKQQEDDVTPDQEGNPLLLTFSDLLTHTHTL